MASPKSFNFLAFIVFMGVVAFCAIIYELLIADVLSYLLGDSVLYFSVTIGLFLSSMGIGSYFSYKIANQSSELLGKLVLIEFLLGALGGFSTTIIYYVASFSIVISRTAYGSFLGSTIPLHIISFIIIAAIGILVGLEIPLLTRFVSKSSEMRYSLANVLAADYLGSFIGSIAFPILLLPNLGVIKASFLAGILNVATVFLILPYYKTNYRKSYFIAAGILIVLLGAFFISSQKIENNLDRMMYTYKGYTEIETSFHSPYQKIVMTKRDIYNNTFIALFLNGFFQFDSERESYEYHEMLVHPAFMFAEKSDSVLILGGGDGLPAKEGLRHKNVRRIVDVDIDPEIVRFSQTNRYLSEFNDNSFNNKRVEIVIQDAFIYVRRAKEKFDIIIVDFPEGNDVSLSRSYSLQFMKDLERILSPGGVIVFQADVFDSGIFYNILKTAEAANLHFISFPVLKYDMVPSNEVNLRSGEAVVLVGRDKFGISDLNAEDSLQYFTYKSTWKNSFDYRLEEKDVQKELAGTKPNTVYMPTYLHYYRQDFFREYDIGA